MNNTFTQLNQKQKLSNEVVKQLEDSILNKVLIPNQKLPAENELCNIFGVSRTVIREALHMLDTKGLVTVKRGKKTVVNEYHKALKLNPIQFYLECNLNDRLIQDWINIRSIMEPTFARFAAKNRNDGDISILKQILENMSNQENLDHKKRAELDKNFHSAIANATQNPLIPIIMKPIFDMMPKIKSIVMQKINFKEEYTNDEHENIINCIIRKDSDGAFLAMVNHMESAKKHVYDTHI
jgi:GntR family transcriptional repressor for pyruvate dehydrogenase complex